MKQFILLLMLAATAESWMFRPGFYSHNQGQRVTQYARPLPAYVPDCPSYRQKVYHHDYGPWWEWNYWHVVETWNQ